MSAFGGVVCFVCLSVLAQAGLDEPLRKGVAIMHGAGSDAHKRMSVAEKDAIHS